MKVLVTGASGFLGSHLVKTLALDSRVTELSLQGLKNSIPRPDCGKPVHPFMVDLSDLSWVRKTMGFADPDVIFHLAANPLVKETSPETSASNYIATHNLLDSAPAGCRFIFASSAEVYGHTLALNRLANEYDEATPNSVYGTNKLASEMLVRVYSEQRRVNGVCLRPAAIVGNGAGHGLLPDLVTKLTSPGGTVQLFGDRPGSCKASLHADDAVSAFITAGFNPYWGYWNGVGVANVASTGTVSVEEAAKLAMVVTGIEKKIEWLGDSSVWAGDNPRVELDTSLARRCGWKPRHERSIDAVCQALRDIYES